MKKATEYNIYVYSLELCVKTFWAWSKIEGNSKFKFKVLSQNLLEIFIQNLDPNLNSKFEFKVQV